MSTHHPTGAPATGPAPTARQQRYLRQLALERGVTFTPPATRAEASALIDQLRRRQPERRADRHRDVRAARDALAGGRAEEVRS